MENNQLWVSSTLSSGVKEFINGNRGFVVGVLDEYDFENDVASLLVYDFTDNPEEHTPIEVINMDRDTVWIKQHMVYNNDRLMQGYPAEDLVVIVKNYRTDVLPDRVHMGNMSNLKNLKYESLGIMEDAPYYKVTELELPVVNILTEIPQTQQMQEVGLKEYLVTCVMHLTHPLVASDQTANVVRIKARVRVSETTDFVPGVHQACVVSTLTEGQGLSYLEILS